MMELRRIEDDIAAGRIERPRVSLDQNQPIPGKANNLKHFPQTSDWDYSRDKAAADVGQQALPGPGDPVLLRAGQQREVSQL